MDEQTFGPVRFLPGGINGRYPNCNSLYIEGARVLIDPASDREQLVRLREDPGVKSIWLSHYHDDHILNLDLFDDVPLCVSKLDAPPLADIDVYLDRYRTRTLEEAREYWREYLLNQVHYRPRTPAGVFEGGEEIRFAGVTVEIIHTPGHTGGHLSFFIKEEGVLFLGDYDLSGFGPVCADSLGSYSDAMKSIRRLRSIPAKVWITSHGPGVYLENPDSAWDRYLATIEKREDDILDALTRPMTLEEITELGIVYGKPDRPRGFYIPGERGAIHNHLKHLIEESRVRKDGKFYSVSRRESVCRTDS